MITVSNLSLYLGNQLLLQQLSFEVKPGQLVALLGANGVGKSTLLKTIAGARLPNISYQGVLCYQQQPLSSFSPFSLAATRAVMSQQHNLLFPITVLELVLLGRLTTGRLCTAAENRKIALEALSLVDMLDFQTRNAQTLSGGEQQRVQLARALAQLWTTNRNTPKILLLDEPTASLDIHYQHFLLQTIRTLCVEKGFAVLSVLHDINIAAQYADELVVLKKGKMLAQGAPREVLSSSLIQEAFGVDSVIQEHPILHCPQILTFATL